MWWVMGGVVALVCCACNGQVRRVGGAEADSVDTGDSGGGSRSSNTSGGRPGTTADGGSGGSSASTGGEAEGGAAGDSGVPGAGGVSEPGVVCESSVTIPEDTCQYPESLGGGVDPDSCGVTPGAWYPLGDSDLSVWPARADLNDPDAGSGIVPGVSRLGNLAVHSNAATLTLGCDLHAWDGDAWTLIEPPPVESGWSCQRMASAVDPSGQRIWVAWYDEIAQDDYHLLAFRQLATGWEMLGEPILNMADEHFPESVHPPVFDAEGNPMVWYSIHDDQYSSHSLARWDGGAWDTMYVPSDGRQLQLTSDGRLFVLGLRWADPYDYDMWFNEVHEWSGEQWSDLTDPTLSLTDGSPVALFLDAEERPVVRQLTEDSMTLFVHRDTGWEQVAADEAMLATLPFAARVPPPRSEDGDVRFRYFEDCRFRGLSASDRDGGVSNSVTDSSSVVSALGDDRVCLAWEESGDSEQAILARCHDLP